MRRARLYWIAQDDLPEKPMRPCPASTRPFWRLALHDLAPPALERPGEAGEDEQRLDQRGSVRSAIRIETGEGGGLEAADADGTGAGPAPALLPAGAGRGRGEPRRHAPKALAGLCRPARRHRPGRAACVGTVPLPAPSSRCRAAAARTCRGGS